MQSITLDLYNTVEDLLKSGRNGAALIYDGHIKRRHKASLFRIVWYQRDDECWLPHSQYKIHEGSGNELAKLEVTEWIWERRKQAQPMGILGIAHQKCEGIVECKPSGGGNK